MHDGGSYRELMARLAALPPAHAAERAQILRWYEEQVTAADAAASRAADEALDADSAVAEARSTNEWADIEAHRLWQKLERRVGRRRVGGRRLGGIGPLPDPAPSSGPDDDPFDALRAAAESVGVYGAGASSRGVPPVLLGLLLAILVGLLAAAGWLIAR